MSSLIGQQLGNFEIVSLLGRGGMATVYRARQLNIKREVAIKVIKPDLAESSDFTKRFEREAETIASLGHPHILKLFEYGQHGDIVFLVTELLRGGSLAELIRKGPLPLETVSQILDQISSALDYAHNRGIIHRDLKPQNVLMDEQGNAFLTDFGIAKLMHQTTHLTQSGMAMGTPAYMAPEQWQTKTSDARADIYALGIMLFEMLAGRLPFDGETPAQMLYMHLQVSPPLIREVRSDLPPGVDAIIDKALAKNREDRFQSAGEMARAFKAALAGQTPVFTAVPQTPLSSRVSTPPVLARPTPPRGETTQTLPRQSRSMMLGIGVVALALILIAGSAVVILKGPGATATLTPSNAMIQMPTVQLAAATITVPTTVQVAAAPTQTDTLQPTATPSSTPNMVETVNAMVNQTLTAALKSATPTGSATGSPTPSLSPTLPSTSSSIPATITPSPTFTLTGTSSATPTFTLTSRPVASATAPALTTIPCTISTDKANTVAIRVGPGKTRGLRDYMTPNRAYQVAGQAQASDGSAWWKLKTDDNSEAWVAQADVKTSGDCGQASVVPTPAVQVARPKATNTSAPVAQPPGGGGGNGGGDDGGGGGGDPPPTSPPSCGGPGASCTGDGDCCSGSCDTGSMFQCY